jgi:hypothetical protein
MVTCPEDTAVQCQLTAELQWQCLFLIRRISDTDNLAKATHTLNFRLLWKSRQDADKPSPWLYVCLLASQPKDCKLQQIGIRPYTCHWAVTDALKILGLLAHIYEAWGSNLKIGGDQIPRVVYCSARLEILTDVWLKIKVVMDVTPCRLVKTDTILSNIVCQVSLARARVHTRFGIVAGSDKRYQSDKIMGLLLPKSLTIKMYETSPRQ